MKMSMKKLSTRSILGVVCLSLVVSSGFALFLFSQTLPALSVSNPAGLTSLCASPLIAGTTVNNGTAGGHESFTTAYSCSTPIASPYLPTAIAQGVLSVVTAASYIPTFVVDTSASTATITSVTLQLNAQSIQGGASFCTTGIPLFTLTSGTAQVLATSYSCQNGGTPSTTNVMWYTVVVVASTFGTVNVAQVTITWKSQ
jgi:hypothetical protein